MGNLSGEAAFPHLPLLLRLGWQVYWSRKTEGQLQCAVRTGFLWSEQGALSRFTHSSCLGSGRGGAGIPPAVQGSELD